MLLKLETVRTSGELIDTAFKKAKNVSLAYHPDKATKTRNWDINKVKVIEDTLVKSLKKYLSSFPDTDQLNIFYLSLLDTLVGTDQYKISLSSLNWAKNKVMELGTKTIKELEKTRDLSKMRSIMNHYFGRVGSVVKGIDKDLNFLKNAREKIKQIPDLNLDLFTVVVAGYPNVGKSELVSKISSAKPEIATYPFTTKGILVGYLAFKRFKVQIIDTPGLLDRPIEESNIMEKQAVLALRHLADLIIFILDPSETCGYTLDKQMSLLSNMKSNFEINLVPVENKLDLIETDSKNIKVSAKTGACLDKLINLIEEKAAESE
jgi:nucleolar GTP-binding protein